MTREVHNTVLLTPYLDRYYDKIKISVFVKIDSDISVDGFGSEVIFVRCLWPRSNIRYILRYYGNINKLSGLKAVSNSTGLFVGCKVENVSPLVNFKWYKTIISELSNKYLNLFCIKMYLYDFPSLASLGSQRLKNCNFQSESNQIKYFFRKLGNK